MFLDRIRQQYGELTSSQRKLADFLSSSPYDAAFMNASELARHLELDAGTVVRFAQRLGYPGYPELAKDMQALVKERLRARYEPPTGKLDARQRFVASLARERENLEQAMTHIPAEVAVEIVSHLRQAQNIYLLAQSKAIGPATLLANSLSDLGLPVRPAGFDLIDWAANLRAVGEGDVVVGLGFTKYAYEAANAVRFARNRGATTIGLVGSATCPIAQAAELVLICPSKSELRIPSEVTMIAVIRALFESLLTDETERLAADVAQFQEVYRTLMESRMKNEAAKLKKDVIEEF